MKFQTRNLYYLRISATTVIPLYLYLDERHVEWMSERVLQHVLSDLRPLILPKLNAEADAHLGPGGPANAKRGTLDVHRGDTYQFGYFLRGTEPHAVLIKTRTFTVAPRSPPQTAASTGRSARLQPSAASKSGGRKRKLKPRPRGKGKTKAADGDAISVSSDDEESTSNERPELLSQRSRKRSRNVLEGGHAEFDHEMLDVDSPAQYDPQHPGTIPGDHDPTVANPPKQHVEVTLKREEVEPSLTDIPAESTASDVSAELVQEAEGADEATMHVEVIEDEEEPKPKPILKLSYHGFNIHGQCLCVIVEPYPPLRSTTRAPSLAPTGLIAPRAPSIAPPDFVPSGGATQRERTPLFLPDFDKEPTPAPTTRNLPPVPLFNESSEGNEEEEDAMVLFSQILRSVGDHPPGIAEDEDEIEGAVFFGDADEIREL
ncbi:hypothetical protein BD414DRAFT_526393 [Trametes punicea]|nr:hypothetical protein BD414DRAFT_526393 [Trametes punicea]